MSRRFFLARLSAGAARTLLGVLPSVAVACLGGVYVVRCVQTLANPGVPVRVRYAAEGGIREVYADSFKLDVSKLTVYATRVRLYAPGEPTSVSVESLAVQQLGPVQTVRASGVAARVVREKSGRVDLQTFGLKPSGKPDTSIVRVDVDRATFFVFDQASQDPRWQTINMGATHAEGAFGNWTARTTVSGLGLSNLPVSANIPVAGPKVVSTWANYHDLAPAVRLLSLGGYVNIPGLDAQHLVVTGPASVTIDGDRITPNGDVFIQGKGLNYPGYARDLAVSGRLTGSGQSWTADLRASSPSIEATFRGQGMMGATPELDGLTDISVANLESIPTTLFKYVPKDIHASGLKISGRIAALKNQPIGHLTFSVSQASYQKNIATNVNGDVVCANGDCTLDLRNASVGKGGVEGRVTYRISNQALSGFVRTKGNASVLLASYLPKELSLNAKAVAVIGGTLKSPLVSGYATGSGAYRISADQTVTLDQATLRAETAGNDVRVLFEGRGPAGDVRATGYVKDQYRQLDLSVQASRLNMAAIDRRYGGSGRAWATVKGSVGSPVVDGQVQAVDLTVKDLSIPALRGSFHFQDKKLTLVDAAAMTKGGVAAGHGTLDLATNSLNAEFRGNGFSLSELGIGQAFGRVDVVDGTVSGTVDHPVVTATASINNAYVARYKVDSATATVHFRDNRATTDNLVVKADKGSLTGKGVYDTDSQKWNVDFVASKLPIERLNVDVAQVNPSGTLALRGNVSGVGAKVATGTSQVRVDDVVAFGQTVGSGTIDAVLEGNTVRASGQIGDLDKVIDITSATYNLDTGATHFSVDASEVKLGRILQSLAAQNTDWNADVRSLLGRVDSVVSAHIEGENETEGHFHFRVPVLEARDILLNGRPAGVVTLDAENFGDTVKINAFSWKHLDAVAIASGSVTNHGPISGEVSVTNLTAETLATLVPSLPIHSGKLAELTVSLGGTTDDPTGRASATFSQVTLADAKGNPIPAPLDISIFDATLVDKVVNIDGSFNVTAPSKETKTDLPVAGLSGTLMASAPLSVLDDNSSSEYTATVQLTKPRPASLLAQFLPILDPKKTVGEITGSLSVHGRKNDPHFQGQITLGPQPGGAPAKLEFADGSFAINNVAANLSLSEVGAQLTANGTTGQDQPASLDLRASYPNLIANGLSLDELRTTTFLNGTAQADTEFKTTLPGASRPSSARVAARFQVGGVLQRPEISGEVNVSRGSVALPLFFATTAGGAPPEIDPAFNVKLNLAQGTKVDAPLASLTLSQAQGTLGGRLSDPVLRMPLAVESGIVRLPTSRIRIDPGSQVAIAMEQGGTPRLDLNVTGHANYTKKITESIYQTYDLNLQIQGNLISEEPLRITGQSDPVGLSQDEIQAFVTQRGLIETLVNTATGSSSASNTQSALYSVAVPSLSGFLTDPVAEALGLDFLTLDYNPFDQTVVSAGKTFGRRLTLQFTRQVVAPINALPRQEIRLSYAFPSRNRFLSQFRLNLTKTQTTPWRIGLGVGGRF